MFQAPPPQSDDDYFLDSLDEEIGAPFLPPTKNTINHPPFSMKKEESTHSFSSDECLFLLDEELEAQQRAEISLSQLPPPPSSKIQGSSPVTPSCTLFAIRDFYQNTPNANLQSYAHLVEANRHRAAASKEIT